MKRFLRQILPAALCLSALGGCMKWDYGRTEDFSATERGLFIVNEGMFQYGNATLSYYDPETKTVENEVFPPGQRLQAGRRGAVDDPAQRRGMDRGKQFACRFRRRPRHLPRGGTHHQPHLARGTSISFRTKRPTSRRSGTTASSSSTPNATKSRDISSART